MWQGKGLFITIGIVEKQQNYYEQWGKKGISELRIKILRSKKFYIRSSILI